MRIFEHIKSKTTHLKCVVVGKLSCYWREAWGSFSQEWSWPSGSFIFQLRNNFDLWFHILVDWCCGKAIFSVWYLKQGEREGNKLFKHYTCLPKAPVVTLNYVQITQTVFLLSHSSLWNTCVLQSSNNRAAAVCFLSSSTEIHTAHKYPSSLLLKIKSWQFHAEKFCYMSTFHRIRKFSFVYV